MEDQQTTTEVAVETTGAQEALPAATDQTTTADTGADDQGTTSTDEGNSQSEIDDKLKKYAESQGLDLDSPSAIKAAKIAMNNQAEVTRNHHKTSQLKKSMETVSDDYAEQEAQATGQDPELVKTVKRLLVRDAIREFWDQHPEAKNHEGEIAAIVQERPYLANDLEAAYALIQAKSAKSEGGRQALETLANKQRTAAPSGSAVNSAISTKPSISRAEIAKRTQAGDVAWLDKNMPTINQMVAEGTLN